MGESHLADIIRRNFSGFVRFKLVVRGGQRGNYGFAYFTDQCEQQRALVELENIRVGGREIHTNLTVKRPKLATLRPTKVPETPKAGLPPSALDFITYQQFADVSFCGKLVRELKRPLPSASLIDTSYTIRIIEQTAQETAL